MNENGVRAGGAVFLSQWWVPAASTAAAEINRLADVWDKVELPSWVRGLRFYRSVDGLTCLMYVECEPSHTVAPLDDQMPAGLAGSHLAQFSQERSFVVDECPVDNVSAAPCVVVDSFDVDGPDQQRAALDLIAQRISQVSESGREGLLGAHLHRSVDGTRVLGFAEWTSGEAHERFVTGRSRHADSLMTEARAGVRPIGFTRYHLSRTRTVVAQVA